MNRNGRAYVLVLEGATDVGLHVALPGARRSHRGGNRISAWFGQYDAWRFAKPLAETHAAARVAAIRRNHCHHGDDLGDGSLIRKNARAHFIGAARIYSTFSFGCLGFFFFVAAE